MSRYDVAVTADIQFAVEKFEDPLAGEYSFEAGGVKMQIQTTKDSIQVSWTEGGRTYYDLICYEGDNGPYYGLRPADVEQAKQQVSKLVPDAVYGRLEGFLRAYRLGLL